jgi:hypothetical protein
MYIKEISLSIFNFNPDIYPLFGSATHANNTLSKLIVNWLTGG